jgi:hypothetical protein
MYSADMPHNVSHQAHEPHVATPGYHDVVEPKRNFSYCSHPIEALIEIAKCNYDRIDGHNNGKTNQQDEVEVTAKMVLGMQHVKEKELYSGPETSKLGVFSSLVIHQLLCYYILSP